VSAARARRAARRRRAAPALAAALAALAALAAPGARDAQAATEEFSTFDVARLDEDDESLLDHLLLRAPRAWRDEWERAPQALRTTQGCLTSGQWFIRTDARFRTALGARAEFGVLLTQDHSDRSRHEALDLETRFATRLGTLGASFRPYFDKSRQDFALFWQTGHDTLPLRARLTFTVEDMFNNLWAWRQTRVGEGSASYVRHPYEPAFEVVARGARWRAEAGGRYLTPSIRDEGPAYLGGALLDRRVTLWGAAAWAALEGEAPGWGWEARTENRQVSSTGRPLPPAGAPGPADSAALAAGDDGRFRRLWSAEAAVRRALGPALEAEVRALYLGRTQRWRPPGGDGRLDAIERVVAAELRWRAHPRLAARAGGQHNRITMARAGATPTPPHGTRRESRAYVGLEARFGNVRVFGVEGIELDPERYEVWFVHDKGFVGLQATF